MGRAPANDLGGKAYRCSLAERDKFPDHPGIYVMHFPNGKKYVGMSRVSIRTRLLHHMNAALSGRHKMPVRAAIAKYGLSSIISTFPAVEGDPAEEEKRLISQMMASGVGLYNMTAGGDGAYGWRHSEAVRAAMSKAAKASWSDERRASASEKLRSPDVRDRLSKAQRKSWDSQRRFNMAERIRARSAKLSEGDVKAIAKMLAEGASCAGIGRKFSVTAEAISAIKHGRNWSHITGINRSE